MVGKTHRGDLKVRRKGLDYGLVWQSTDGAVVLSSQVSSPAALTIMSAQINR